MPRRKINSRGNGHPQYAHRGGYHRRSHLIGDRRAVRRVGKILDERTERRASAET